MSWADPSRVRRLFPAGSAALAVLVLSGVLGCEQQRDPSGAGGDASPDAQRTRSPAATRSAEAPKTPGDTAGPQSKRDGRGERDGRGDQGGGKDLQARLARPVPDGIDWQRVAEDIGRRTTCPPGKPRGCVVVRGPGPHVSLVGDSHGRMLAPAFVKLAREHDLTLSLNIVNACPWQAGITNTNNSRQKQQACTDGRRNWYRQTLPKLDPDLLVVVSSGRQGADPGMLVRTGGSDESIPELLRATTQETLATFRKQRVPVLMVESIMGTGGMEPVECLRNARRLGECAVPVPEEASVDAAYREAAGGDPRRWTVDLDPVFCPGGGSRCAPILDGTVVWRNPNHLTAQIAVDRRDRIWQRMLDSGAPLR